MPTFVTEKEELSPLAMALHWTNNKAIKIEEVHRDMDDLQDQARANLDSVSRFFSHHFALISIFGVILCYALLVSTILVIKGAFLFLLALMVTAGTVTCLVTFWKRASRARWHETAQHDVPRHIRERVAAVQNALGGKAKMTVLALGPNRYVKAEYNNQACYFLSCSDGDK